MTAAALLWQTRVNNDREDRRIALESTERDQARRHSVRDHWREERKEAHTALLADFEAAAKDLSRQTRREEDEPSGVSEALTQRLSEHFATVQMLSLGDTRTAAEKAFEAFARADNEAWTFALIGGITEADDDEMRVKAQTAVLEFRKVVALYLDAVRKEIGTDEDGV